MPFEVVKVQSTPNPNATKLILDKQIADQPTSFFNSEAAQNHPIASQIFAIPGVSSLLLLGDFITVNKQSTVRWAEITDRVREVLKKI